MIFERRELTDCEKREDWLAVCPRVEFSLALWWRGGVLLGGGWLSLGQDTGINISLLPHSTQSSTPPVNMATPAWAAQPVSAELQEQTPRGEREAVTVCGPGQVCSLTTSHHHNTH